MPHRAGRTGNRFGLAARITGAALALLVLGSQPAVAGASSACHESQRGSGTLFIVGGRPSDELLLDFLRRAGGVDSSYVYIPTAKESPARRFDRGDRLGAKNYTVLHTKDIREANSDEFVEIIDNVDAVWIGGGRQWRIADSFLHTRVHDALLRLLQRGGMIGGNSAGASIQGSYLVRGDTSGPDVMRGDHRVGFGLLECSAIDQHVDARGREQDLGSILSNHPELLGLGISEDTAVVIDGDRLEVTGASFVWIWDHWQHGNGNVSVVSAGTRYDLTSRQLIEEPGSETVLRDGIQPVDYGVEAAGKGKDVAGRLDMQADGGRLRLYGNSWKAIPFEYEVTADTVLEFEFESPGAGDSHGIGFDSDLQFSAERRFSLGEQRHAGDIGTYASYLPGSTTRYRIPVGRYYTGKMKYVFFTLNGEASDDGGNAVSSYRNARVFEQTQR